MRWGLELRQPLVWAASISSTMERIWGRVQTAAGQRIHHDGIIHRIGVAGQRRFDDHS